MMIPNPSGVNNWYRVGFAAEMAAKGATEILIGSRLIAVFFDAGNWYAMDSVCAHQGGPLARGFVADGCVTCPWHGWQYRLADGCNTVTQRKMLEVYPVRIVDDAVEVGLDA